MLRRDRERVCIPRGKVIRSIDNFAPLPAVAVRVIGMVADQETSVTDLEPVLKGDVALVASVLRLANSAFYGVRREVSSLRHALLLLGKSEVQCLVLSQILFQAFKTPKGLQKTLMADIWRHSLECALAAECIAEQCGEGDSIYFLGGMLHDIGKLVIVQKFLDDIQDPGFYGQSVGIEGLEVESERLGCGHDELGCQLLNRWLFPHQLVEMVRDHHEYERIAECKRPSQIIILANLLCRWTVFVDVDDKAGEADFSALLLRCGKDSKLIPDTEALLDMGEAYRQRLEERATLLEMLQM